MTNTPPPNIANPAASDPSVSVNGLDRAVTFSCLKFNSLAVAISLLILDISNCSALKDLTFLIPLKISSKLDARLPI